MSLTEQEVQINQDLQRIRNLRLHVEAFVSEHRTHRLADAARLALKEAASELRKNEENLQKEYR